MSDKRKIDQPTERLGGRFLFDQPSPEDNKSDSFYMDMRTRIKSSQMMQALLFYNIMAGPLGSNRAREIKDAIERLLIAHNGEGRAEAVAILRQSFPKTREIEKGVEEMDEWTRKAFSKDS